MQTKIRPGRPIARYCPAMTVCAALLLTPLSAAVAGDPIAICVNAAGTLRLTPSVGPCRPGETRKLFTEWEPEAGEAPDDPGDTALADQVRTLSQRVAQLESARQRERADSPPSPETKSGPPAKTVPAATTASRVVAPFEVVSASGQVILRVADVLAATPARRARVTIAAGSAGNYGVRVHNAAGEVVAGIGQALKAGGGVVVVQDDTGRSVAAMSAPNKEVVVRQDDEIVAAMRVEARGGTVGVYHNATPVAYLTRSSAGDGGNVTTSLNNGFGVFSAGAAQDGGGEACLNRVTGGGQQRRSCLGIELPSMGLGK